MQENKLTRFPTKSIFYIIVELHHNGIRQTIKSLLLLFGDSGKPEKERVKGLEQEELLRRGQLFYVLEAESNITLLDKHIYVQDMLNC